MKMNAVPFLSLCLVCLAVAQDPVAYGNYDNSTTANPMDHNHHNLGEPVILPHGSSDADGAHSHSMMHSDPIEMETVYDQTTNNPSVDASESDFLNMASQNSTDMGDMNSTEQGPSTKPSHIMSIPPKNMTMDADNSTDSSSMDKDALSATSAHDSHSKGSGSSASALVVLALFTLSTRVLLSH